MTDPSRELEPVRNPRAERTPRELREDPAGTVGELSRMIIQRTGGRGTPPHTVKAPTAAGLVKGSEISARAILETFENERSKILKS